MELNSNFEELDLTNEENINGGIRYTKLIGGAVGLAIVSPICGVVGGPFGYGAAFSSSAALLFSGLD